jgi:diguanylate cyclase
LVEDLFIHLCIVVAFIFVGGMFFKNNPYILTVKMKIFLGMIAGVLGSLLLYFSIRLDENTIMDMRHIALIISSIFGGLISTIVTAIFIATTRIILFGISPSSMIAFTGTLSVGLVLGILFKLKISLVYKWILMLLTSTSVYSFVLYLLMGDSKDFFPALGYYWILSLVSGYVAYYFSNYISISNQRNYDYKQQATVDFLTGLNNQRMFATLTKELLSNANLKKQHLSLMLFDIDYFKKINDLYGHPNGDNVLRDLGFIIKQVTRQKDLLFRTGGEEFAIIMLDTDINQATDLAENLRSAVDDHQFTLLDGTFIECTVSIGLSTNFNYALAQEKLIKDADEALYRAKREGRNKVCWHKDES